MALEIERKFWLDRLPQGLPLLEHSYMEQSYLAFDPVVRIRKKVCSDRTSYRLCLKGEGTLARQEIELDLPPETYQQMLLLVKGTPIRKEQWVYQLPQGLKLECNLVDEGDPYEFYYAEVEFETVQQAERFVPPSYLGKELTEDTDFTMASYWQQTRGKQK